MNKIDRFLNENIYMDGFNYNSTYVDVLNEVREHEDTINQLFEKKGVAMYSFKTEISNLIDYIEQVFYNSFKKRSWQKTIVKIGNDNVNCLKDENLITFEIPKELAKKITFIKNLKIYINIANYMDVEDSGVEKLEILTQSAARMNDLCNLTFLRKRLKNGYVTCNLISVNGNLKREDISNALYHELGHYYQEFNLQKNGTKMHDTIKNQKFYRNKAFFSSENEYMRKIGFLFYILFNNFELSQHASGIYAELVEMNPQIQNINEAITNTKTYNRYLKMKNDIDILNKYNGIDIWEASKTFYTTKSHPNGYKFTSEQFKEKFIKESINRLKIFYRKMISAAELYIQDKEENNF